MDNFRRPYRIGISMHLGSFKNNWLSGSAVVAVDLSPILPLIEDKKEFLETYSDPEDIILVCFESQKDMERVGITGIKPTDHKKQLKKIANEKYQDVETIFIEINIDDYFNFLEGNKIKNSPENRVEFAHLFGKEI